MLAAIRMQHKMNLQQTSNITAARHHIASNKKITYPNFCSAVNCIKWHADADNTYIFKFDNVRSRPFSSWMFVLLIEAFHVFLHKPKVTIRTMSMHNDIDVLQKKLHSATKTK